MKRNRRYPRYRGFRLTPHELRVGIGVYRARVRCLRVRVRCGKTRPSVYPWRTLFAKCHLQCSMVTTDLARTHWPFLQILKQALPDYLTSLSPKNVNICIFIVNRIPMQKIGTKISKKLTSSRYFVVSSRFTFPSEMAPSFPEFIAQNPENNTSNY